MLIEEQEQAFERALEKRGDVDGLRYIQRLKDEVRSKVEYIHEQDEVIKHYKHCAEVAEQALKDITDELPCSYCAYGFGYPRQCDLDNRSCLENCLSVAERNLQRRKNNDRT